MMKRRKTAWRLVLASISIFMFVAVAHAQKRPPAKPIDVNAATAEQLPASTRNWTQHRSPFQKIEDLLAIKGISKSRPAKMHPYLTFNPASRKSL
jgi:DNA uptake protein ComE-like DNA-binding protein